MHSADVAPTKAYAANSAWQQLSVFAPNLMHSFQLTRAGRLTRIAGRNVVRLTTNPATGRLHETAARRLGA